MDKYTHEEQVQLTPDSGFNLIGIDYFESKGSRAYIIEHFDNYADALSAKKQRDSDDFFIFYKDASDEYLSR